MKQELRKKFAKFVTANVLGMIGLSCYILADTYFVSERLGAEGLTSLNLAISLYSVINGLGLMLGIGGATRYAIAKAAEKQNGKQIFTGAFFWGMVLGLLLALTGLLGAKELAGLLGAKGNIRNLTEIYLRTVLMFSPCFILNNIFIAFVRNDGSPKMAMTAMLCGSFSNILLDYVFMYPLNLGIFGAAFATGLAPVISIGLMLFSFRKRKPGFGLKKYGADFRDLADMGSLGLAAFVNEVSSGVVLVTFNLVILGLAGNTGVAAYGIVANLALVAVAVCNGIAQGSQPLVSSCYGAGEKTLMRKIYAWSAVTALVCGVLIVVFIYGNTGVLVSIFNGEQNRELASIASQGLCLYMPGFLAAGINIVSSSYFSAVECPKESFAIAIVRGCLGILAAVAVLTKWFGMTGVWLSFPAAEAMTLVLTFFFWKKKYGMSRQNGL